MATRTRRPGIGSRRLGQAHIGLHYACAVLRRLLRDSAIYGAAGLFSQGIAFLLFPFLAHKLDPHAYGVVDIVGVLTTLALLTVTLEINQGLGRAVKLSAANQRTGLPMRPRHGCGAWRATLCSPSSRWPWQSRLRQYCWAGTSTFG